MTPEEKGKFCNKCSKTEHDFKEKTDQEVLDTINNSADRVCGYFRKSQINRSIVVDYPVSNNKSIVLVVLGGEGVTAVPGMNESVMGKTAIVQQQYYLKGKVLDNFSQEAIPFVNVEVYNGDSIFRGLLTDSNDSFRITVAESELENLRIEYSFVGYEDQVYARRTIDIQDKIELMPAYINEPLGEVILFKEHLRPPQPPLDCLFIKGDRVAIKEYLDGDVIEVVVDLSVTKAIVAEAICYKNLVVKGLAEVVSTKSIIEPDNRSKEEEISLLRSQITVFPNPSTGQVNVEFPEEGKYIVELFDLIGKRVFKERINTERNYFIVNCLEKGSYVLKVLNVATIKVDSERLLVR